MHSLDPPSVVTRVFATFVATDARIIWICGGGRIVGVLGRGLVLENDVFREMCCSNTGGARPKSQSRVATAASEKESHDRTQRCTGILLGWRDGPHPHATVQSRKVIMF